MRLEMLGEGDEGREPAGSEGSALSEKERKRAGKRDICKDFITIEVKYFITIAKLKQYSKA